LRRIKKKRRRLRRGEEYENGNFTIPKEVQDEIGGGGRNRPFIPNYQWPMSKKKEKKRKR